MEIEAPSLYSHQDSQLARLRESLAKHGASILCANPGVGKTRMSKAILAKFLLATQHRQMAECGRSGRAVFCVHRRSLVDNASNSFKENPKLPHGIIMSKSPTDWSKQVSVGSIDTMLSWYVGDEGQYKSDTTFDLVIFDECHSHFKKLEKWFQSHAGKRQILGLKPAVLIGLSATPEGDGLSELFNNIVLGETTEWLTENSFLCKFEYYCGTKGDLSKLKKTSYGEFTEDSVADAFRHLEGDLVRDWKRYSKGRPTVGFFPRIEQSVKARDLFRSSGVRAEHVDGTTPDDERALLFRQLGRGDIDYLCNVGVVERGTNIPEIAVVQLATAVGSVVRFRQMIGRGSRTSPDKEICTVIDHGANCRRHGAFTDEVDWTLDNKVSVKKDYVPPVSIECPSCGRVFRGGKCLNCQAVMTAAELRQQGAEFDGTELKPFVPKKAPKKLYSNNDVMVIALYKAARSGRTLKQAMGIAYGIAKSNGIKDFKIPKEFEIAKQVHKMPPYGSLDQNRRVEHLFTFLKAKTYG